MFLLNRYFAEMGHAVEAAGGRIDKFIGDGVMALFGLDSGVEAGCREALAAAKGMAERMQILNRALVHDISEPLRIGIGIHTGPAIVGEMGYGTAVSITAVGNSVNTASRIESLTKTYACELVISEAVVLRAGIDLGAAPRHEIEIRGRVERLVVRTFASARDLPVLESGKAQARLIGSARMHPAPRRTRGSTSQHSWMPARDLAAALRANRGGGPPRSPSSPHRDIAASGLAGAGSCREPGSTTPPR